MCGIIDELTRSTGNNSIVSFFFCQATDVRINKATSVLRGLIYSLVEKQSSLLSHVRSRYKRAGKALFEDINAWNVVSKIFTDILKDPALRNTYLLIDALDECTEGLPSLLDLILQESSTHTHVRWVVSSRNWPNIEERLDIARASSISLELNEAYVSEAVNEFIQHKVHHLAKIKKYKDETRDSVYRYLSANSQGTFLWAALVCQDLARTSRWHVLRKLEAFPSGLNALYSRMMSQVLNSEDAEHCKQILAIMLIVYRPITLSELIPLIEVLDDDYDDRECVMDIIAMCGSFLTLREETIFFVHQSAKEFLLREALCDIIPEGIGAKHLTISERSFGSMFKILRRDILGIGPPGFSTKDVTQPFPPPLGIVQYACVYWIGHLESGVRNENRGLIANERDRVNAFLQQKYLHWLEALSILGSVSRGIQAMQRLVILMQVCSYMNSEMAFLSNKQTTLIGDGQTRCPLASSPGRPQVYSVPQSRC
jgi:hypothetical protein